MNTAILINYAANNHTGKKKWLRIKEKVLQLLPYEPILLPYETPFIIKDCVKKLNKDEGVEFFISAGGDGSVNYLLNALMEVSGERSETLCLGAIGLGSSNDFLKPFINQIDGMPVKIDPNKKILADIGKVSYEDINGIKKSRFFIINASLGITADANLLFNQGDPFIRIMKSRFVNLTILYTAIKTLLNYENKRIRISNGSDIKNLKIANISLTKSPYISGSFHYDQSTQPDSGKLGFHCSGNMTRLEIIKTLWNLSHGRFSGFPKRETSFVTDLKIETNGFLALETDGEVQLGRCFNFSVLPKVICLAS